MEERDQVLIERYLAGEASGADMHEIIQRQQSDPDFQRELKEYESAKEALRLRQRDELRLRFRQRDVLLNKKRTKGTSQGLSKTTRLWILAVTSICLVLGYFLFFYENPKEKIQELTAPAQVQQAPEEKLSVPKEFSNMEPEGNSSKRDKAMNRKRGTLLFAANYKPYKDSRMAPAGKKNPRATIAEHFTRQYWEDRYQQAVDTFSLLARADQDNDFFRFRYANALLAIDQTNKAERILKDLIREKTSVYANEARYILAWLLIKEGNWEEAVINLEEYTKSGKARHRAISMELSRLVK